MHQKQHRHAEGEEGAESVSRETGDADAVEQYQPKQAENRDASQETEFFGNYRKDKVVVRDGARQVAKLSLRAFLPAAAR